MSDRFQPLSMEQLTEWAATELERRGSIFGIPRAAVFVPRPEHRFRRTEYGVELDTSWGVAAGPHTQLAQNIVAAWLAGARLIELKTIQTLDELEIHKPCIDVQDEGYNVEWSQELKVHQSFDEYLRAWVLVHALHRTLGFGGDRPGIIFNMSVGYDLAGVRQPNVTWYLDAMADASEWLPAYVDVVARRFPAVLDIEIPARLSGTVTLSTMHGCPPDEIERISRYLMDERGLHTSVKCNPTLLGPDLVRAILGEELGWRDVSIPDEAFGHDLRYADAVPMFARLQAAAAGRGLVFGLKLSNTLEVRDWRRVFDRDGAMYLSGRALHPVTVNLAATLADEFRGRLPLSFAGGADAFNIEHLLAGGLRTVTVCSDLLKTGGYLRLLQYPERIDAALDAAGARDLDDLAVRTASRAGLDVSSPAEAGRANLRRYSEAVRRERRYRKDAFQTGRTKTLRTLGPFDCIAPPCVDECPVDQAVPRYMAAVRRGDLDEAVRVAHLDNPLPAILGRVCDHLCEQTCIRTHLDEPLAIRHIKRFITEGPAPTTAVPAPVPGSPRIAIVGAGPAGLAAAEWLARAGLRVTIFEERAYAGGMVGGAIPAYRLPQPVLDQDLSDLERLGVRIRYGRRIGTDVTIERLRAEGYPVVLVAVGAQRGRRLGLPGEDAEGVIDGVDFLRGVREGRPRAVGPRVGVIGAGDTAMDCARSARRVGAASVQVIYRRSVEQMPADREEIHALREERIEVVELARPVALRVEGGRVTGLTCVRTGYRAALDAADRTLPPDVPGSEFSLDIDSLILAISQAPVLDLFGQDRPTLTAAGFLATDPVTLETTLPGVYAAGDIAAHGPASIVRAAADGKRAARSIARALGAEARLQPSLDGRPRWPEVDVHALTLRRAHRQYRVPIRVTGPEHRDGFEETVLPYAAEEAVREASRCLDCDALCSLCVGVCPNLALFTWRTRPIDLDLTGLLVRGGTIAPDGTRPFRVEQPFQVAVLNDLCNECGTCVVACPTAGRPYVDKPRLYLDVTDFEAQSSNAFRLLDSEHVAGRFDGATHHLEVGRGPDDGHLIYRPPGLRIVLDRGSFEILETAADGDPRDGPRSLEPAAIMASLLDGISESMPHLPFAQAPGSGTRVAAPG